MGIGSPERGIPIYAAGPRLVFRPDAGQGTDPVALVDAGRAWSYTDDGKVSIEGLDPPWFAVGVLIAARQGSWGFRAVFDRADGESKKAKAPKRRKARGR